MSIVIDQRPGAANSDANSPYPNLRRNPSLLTNNQGGKFSLPPEFDTEKWASGFYLEGNESLAMGQDQPLQGTDLVACGWAVWKYPEEHIVMIPDEDNPGSLKQDLQAHPKANEPHRVNGMKPGEVWLLHCRPKDVQDDVNRVYGELSREQMVREIEGDTFTMDEGANPSGMLTNKLLNAEIGKDSEIEGMPRQSAVVHQGPTNVKTKKSQRVSR